MTAASKPLSAARPFLAPKPAIRPRPFLGPKPLIAAAAALASLTLVACSPLANTGRTTVADNVQFDYSLKPTPKAHTFQLALNLADPKTGMAINDANVAVSVFGPGYDGSELVNLKRGDAGGYGGEVVMPKAASYNLTFEVNRSTGPSASATFAALPPAQVANAAGR